MEFNTQQYEPMEKQKVVDMSPNAPYSDERQGKPDIEKPIFAQNRLGQSVTEGSRFGSFMQTATGAIRAGAGNVELQLAMGGGAEPVGAEAYGKEAREALREMAKANQIEFSATHSPSQIGNMSGFAGPEKGFDDAQRKVELDEVKNAIDFAADTAGKGAIVVHTGEFQRPISEASWATDEEGNRIFTGYEEEEERAILPLVDKRTGNVILQVRKNQIVARAKWNRYNEENDKLYGEKQGESYTDEAGQVVNKGDYVDYEGKKVNFRDRVPVYDEEKNTFIVEQQSWEDFKREAEERNEVMAEEQGIAVEELSDADRVTPEKAFLIATTETQERIAEGWANNYGLRLRESFKSIDKYKKSLEHWKKVEESVPEDEKYQLLQGEGGRRFTQETELIPQEKKLPSAIIEEQLRNTREEIESLKEMVTGQKQQAEESRIQRENAVTIENYAKQKSIKSYTELGIYSMDVSKDNPHAKGDLFVAAENIFPEMGYGSHPEEMTELIKKSREKMAEQLVTSRNFSEEEAKNAAENHIKATIDLQHLGMWRKNFVAKPGESKQEVDDRFEDWYMKQFKKMEKEGIIGHMHIVDGFGRQHTHLPPGQGNLPIKEALKYLKKKGYKGALTSEGFAESQFGPARIITKFWETNGSPIYSRGFSGSSGAASSPQTRWQDVEHSYFGQTYPPNFIFGSYSPSNDWSLWSQTPME
tara:strand:+ start:748 stop:2853 length:2106 start_codon:yes stop_codon:yes gene_type:complete